MLWQGVQVVVWYPLTSRYSCLAKDVGMRIRYGVYRVLRLHRRQAYFGLVMPWSVAYADPGPGYGYGVGAERDSERDPERDRVTLRADVRLRRIRQRKRKASEKNPYRLRMDGFYRGEGSLVSIA